jgi:class 3 adenylate cyclase
MRAGHFDVDLPLEPADELSRLGRALCDLGASLQTRFTEVRTLSGLTAKINSGVLLEEVLDHLYEACAQILPYERIGLALLEDDDRIVRARWSRSEVAAARLLPGFAAPLEGSSLQIILETGRPRILNDLPGYLRAHPSSVATRLIVQEGYRSSLTCPLIARGKPIGFVFFSSTATETYADVHVEMFMQIAGQIACAVEKGRLYEHLIATSEQLERRNRFIRQTFGRYLNTEVVDRLLDSPDGLDMGGEKRRVAILLSDLRGFTPLSEQLPPQQVIALLNDYLGAMVAVIDRFGGTVVEFIGDAILVVFGALERGPDDEERAIHCALEMQRAMPAVNQANRDRGLPSIEMGIAVHTGEAIVGNIGSPRRAKFGVVGATVNAAARLEGCAVGGQVLITEAVRQASSSPLQLGSSIQLRAKGLAQPLEAFELFAVEGGPTLPDLAELTTLCPLQPPRLLEYHFVEAERVGEGAYHAKIVGVSTRRLAVIPERPLRLLSELSLDLEGATSDEGGAESYAKVVARPEGDQGSWLLHFTALSPRARQVVESWLEQAAIKSA